jgi:hypothetical protein
MIIVSFYEKENRQSKTLLIIVSVGYRFYKLNNKLFTERS